ncbi:MAG: hypothetical protein ACTSUI_07210 [Promethearchaeota archaeon]
MNEDNPPEKSDEMENPEKNWEEKLEETIQSKEMKTYSKKMKRKEFREKLKLKTKKLNSKTSELVDNQFVKVFNKKELPYTIIFAVIAIVIGISSSVQIVGTKNTQVIFLTMTSLIGFGLLFLLSRKPKIHAILFDKESGIKYLIALASLIIGAGICIFYIAVIDPVLKTEINFLQFSKLFGFLLAIVYFGWNAVQILFIRKTIEQQAVRREGKFELKTENQTPKKTDLYLMIHNILNLIIPYLVFIAFIVLFIWIDTKQFWAMFGNTTYQSRFIPENFSYQDWLSVNTPTNTSGFMIFMFEYIPDVWFNSTDHFGLFSLSIWTILVLGILIVTTIKQSRLNKSCKVNETRNVFSSTFYMIFWLFLFIKLYSILNTLVGIQDIQNISSAEIDPLNQAIGWISDIALMLLTIVNLLRGFGRKIQGEVGQSGITDLNLVLLMFVLVSSYWGGQWALLTSGFGKSGLSIASGLIVVIVYLGYYYWYSGWILERRGFLRKRSFVRTEVKEMMVELGQSIKDNLLQTIENNEIITSTLNNYLIEKKIVLSGGSEEDAEITTLEKEEEEKSSEEMLEYSKKMLQEAQREKDDYEASLKQLSDDKKLLEITEKKISKLEQVVSQHNPNIQEELSGISTEKEKLEQEIEETKEEYSKNSKVFRKMKIPKEPKPRLTQNGEPDTEANEELEKQYQMALEKHEKAETYNTGLKENIESLGAKLKEITSKLELLQNEYQKSENEKNEYANLKEKHEELQISIKKVEHQLPILKERMEQAQPLLDEAQIFKMTAENEFKGFNDLEEANKELDNAKIKLTEAETILAKRESDYKDAKENLEQLKTQQEIQAEIDALIQQITQFEEQIQQTEKNLQEKEEVLQQRKDQYEQAKTKENIAGKSLKEVEDAINVTENEFDLAEQELNKAQSLNDDLKSTQQALQRAKQDEVEFISVSKAEQQLQDTQSLLKETKSDLKQERKKPSPDGDHIIELTEKIEDLEGKIKKYKEMLKKAKNLHSHVKDLQKKEEQLQHQQIDLEQAHNNVELAKSNLNNTKEKKDAPLTEYNLAKDALVKAETEYKLAETDRDDVKSHLTGLNSRVTDAKSNKEQRMKDLETRKQAEIRESDTKKALKDAENLLSQTNEYVSRFQAKVDKMNKVYAELKEKTSLELDICKSEKNLKEAHKTLKAAISSAEANVRGCEDILKEAKAKKESFLAAHGN